MIAGTDPDIFYDDESADPADAVLIQGISDIQPGEHIIIVLTDSELDVDQFVNIWSVVTDVESVEIGLVDGAGLGGSGDSVTIWIGDPTLSDPVDKAGNPETELFDGKSFDVILNAFSEIDNENGALATTFLGGENGDVLNIASPGNKGPLIINPNAPSFNIISAPFLNITPDGPARRM